MPDAPPPRPLAEVLATLTLTPGTAGLLDWADRLRDDQRQRWERGELVRVEDYLRAFPALAGHTDALLDLIYSEVLLREERGEKVALEEYRERFPMHRDALARQWEVHHLLEGEGLVTTSPLSPAVSALERPIVVGYEVLEELGRGGYGVVYRARQLSLNRLVALKMIHTDRTLSPQHLARFRAEAELIARVAHPNIVQIYKVGQCQGQPFLALEYVAGGSLQDRLDGRPWPIPEAVALIETLARTVADFHAQNVVHRDLKPANVLLALPPHPLVAPHPPTPSPTEGRGGARPAPPLPSASRTGATLMGERGLGGEEVTPKIADFGLAKLREGPGARALTKPGEMLGTPLYMAPEQARGENDRVGPAADQHALGVMLYELLTGKHPFRAEDTLSTLSRISSEVPAVPALLRPGLPPDLEAICLKCLAKELEARYPSVADLADDLRRYRSGLPVRARAVGPVVRLRMWARRQPVIAALSAAVLLALLGGLAAVSWQWHRAEAALVLSERDREDAERARTEADAERTAAVLARAQAEQSQRDEVKAHLASQEAHRNEAAARRRVEQQQRQLSAAFDEAQALLGRSSLALAGQALASRQYAQAQDWLDDCPPGQRDWEWHYLKPLCRVRLLTLPGHTRPDGSRRPVMAVAISPDGRQFASATGAYGQRSPEVRVWEAGSGRLLHTLEGQSSVAYSPDGAWLAAAAPGGGVRLWSPSAPQARQRKLGEGGPTMTGLAFSPDGKHLAAVGADGDVRIWAPAKPTAAPTMVPARARLGFRALAYAPDGSMLAVAGRQNLWFWDVSAGRFVPSPGGKKEERLRVTHPKLTPITALAYPADRNALVTGGGDGVVRVWETKTGKLLFSLTGHTSTVEGLAFNRDRTRLASVGQDGTARLWDFTTRVELAQLPGDRTVALDAAGERMLAGQRDRRLVVWAARLPSPAPPLATHEGAVTALAFDPRTGQLASGGLDNVIRRFVPRERREVAPLRLSAAVQCLAYRPDGRLLAAGLGQRRAEDKSAELRVWGLEEGRESVLRGHTGTVVGLAFSPDGKHLASAGLDGSVRLWDGTTLVAQHVFHDHKGPVIGVTFSPDGKLLASIGQDGKVRLRQAADGTARGGLGVSGTTGHYALAFSPDGQSLAVAGPSGRIVVWDVQSGEEEQTLTGHTGAVLALAYSPNGRRLASTGTDGTVRLWDVKRGQEVLAIRAHKQEARALAFSRDGRYLASGGKDAAVLLYEAPTP